MSSDESSTIWMCRRRFAASIGGMIMAKSVGLVLEATNSNYTLIFAACTVVYFIAVAMIHLLSPRLARVDTE